MLRSGETRAKVRALLERGWTQGAVARELGIAAATVSYHARRLGYRRDARATRRYDWSEVQRYYDAGRSVRECSAHFGFSMQTWHAAVARGAVCARPRAMPLEQLLARGAVRGRHNIKQRLIAAGLKEARCEACGISDWRGAPLSMQLHHVNGDGRDNRLDNLRLLCPNCHSQTENFSGRGVMRRTERAA